MFLINNKVKTKDSGTNKTKGKIKKAAEKLFNQKGYKDTTIQDIAQSAKIAVGTVYRHYQNKSDILSDVGREDLKEVSYSQNARREEILEAALDVFGTKGYSRTNMEDIARKLGKSKAFIYQYFKNKNELFVSMTKESSQMRKILKLAESNDETEPVNIAEKLNQAGEIFLSLISDPRRIKMFRIIVGESPNFPEIGEAFFHEIIETNSDKMGEMLKNGIDDKIDPVIFIRLFVGSLLFFGFLQELVPEKDRKYKLETVIENAVRIFTRGAEKN